MTMLERMGVPLVFCGRFGGRDRLRSLETDTREPGSVEAIAKAMEFLRHLPFLGAFPGQPVNSLILRRHWVLPLPGLCRRWSSVGAGVGALLWAWPLFRRGPLGRPYASSVP